MVCLSLQSTFLSVNKAGKIYKTQSSLNTPISEEENHKEKESDSDAVLYFEIHHYSAALIALTSTKWPRTKARCYSHVADVTVPPPEYC